MIQGELAPKGDTGDVHGAVEKEEGSSSMLGKEEIEGERAASVV